VTAQQGVLAQHHRLARAALLRGREPVVPDQRHPLDQRRLGAHHPVQPPAVVVAPGVARRERAPLIVVGRRAGQPGGRRPRERRDGAVEPDLGEALGLAGPRPEAGAPEQPVGLLDAERAAICGDAGGRHSTLVVRQVPT
jgi:hypothetical protein